MSHSVFKEGASLTLLGREFRLPLVLRNPWEEKVFDIFY